MDNACVDIENGGPSTEEGRGPLSSRVSENMRQLLEESIKVKLNVAEVYLGFHYRFSEDASFWWEMAIEEKNHAALLMSGAQCFLDNGQFPGGIVGGTLETLVNLNVELACILQQKNGENPSSRVAALNLALKLEESAEEMYFQQAMNETGHSSEILTLFQGLNGDEKDHANRIRSYMRQNDMDVICHYPPSHAFLENGFT